jgi:CRISPR-associated exonuclease Cas4
MKIAIRELQHYLYCPHRWGLLYKDEAWQDNALTVMSTISHTNVHSGKTLFSTKNKIVLSDVSVYDDELDIYGKTDCLELYADNNGIEVEGFDGKYKIVVVEYKPTQPKDSPTLSDKLQLYAQKVCIDKYFSTDTDAYFYYFDTKKRVKAQFCEEGEVLKNVIAEINKWRDGKDNPPAEYSAKCDGCSLKNKCMPHCSPVDIKQIILQNL